MFLKDYDTLRKEKAISITREEFEGQKAIEAMEAQLAPPKKPYKTIVRGPTHFVDPELM